MHRVRAKIGDCCPLGAVFVRRRWTGIIYSPEMEKASPARDWILSRILWLDGLEPGVNRGGSVDTARRFIYIHGTAEEHLIGSAVSHGCVRMCNADVVELFDMVSIGTSVWIG